jgi:hypothetical protein
MGVEDKWVQLRRCKLLLAFTLLLAYISEGVIVTLEQSLAPALIKANINRP